MKLFGCYLVLEMVEEKARKDRTTVYVTEDKVELAKERGYNLSHIMESALSAILDIDNDNEVEIKRKIEEIEKSITDLKLQRKVLLNELEDGRVKEKLLSKKLIKQKAFNDTVKEMKDTMDIRENILNKNAEIIGITPEELYDKASKEAGWK